MVFDSFWADWCFLENEFLENWWLDCIAPVLMSLLAIVKICYKQEVSIFKSCVEIIQI